MGGVGGKYEIVNENPFRVTPHFKGHKNTKTTVSLKDFPTPRYRIAGQNVYDFLRILMATNALVCKFLKNQFDIWFWGIKSFLKRCYTLGFGLIKNTVQKPDSVKIRMIF